MALRPRCVLQANADEVSVDSQHLLRSRPALLQDSPFLPMNSNEVQRAQLGMKQFHAQKAAGKDLCDWQDLVVHVGDQPCLHAGKCKWLTWSAVSRCLPTLRRSSGLYVATAKCRQITLHELYSAMGFPTLGFCAQAAGVRLYSIDRDNFTYWQCRNALGNSQHVANVGSVMLAALSCATYK